MEVFRDHYAMNRIVDTGDITFELMTSEILSLPNAPRNQQGIVMEFYIPYLLLLGILYCPGNNHIRARKFFELI